MDIHLPGLVWAVAAFVIALGARLLPDRPPPRHIVDKYLHVPSTFPTNLSNKGLHRSMVGDQSGMSPNMRPYTLAGSRPPRRTMKTMSNKLFFLGIVFVLMAVSVPAGT